MPSQDPRLSQFPHVCIVEASAGTGKTFELAGRYIQLLIDDPAGPAGIPFKNILAITFSNKATLEMKTRIIERLKKAALTADDAQIRERAFALMDVLVRHYNYFQVQTIDSFINAILSGCAFQLGLSANFRIRTDWREYLAHALDVLIDQALTDKKVAGLFGEMLDQYLYLENKTGWFPKQNIYKLAADLFERMNRLGTDYVRLPMNAADILKKKKEILKAMRSLERILPEATHKTFAKNFTEWLARNEETFDLDRISDYFLREDFPIAKGARLPAKVQRSWQDIREKLSVAAAFESAVIFNPYVDVFRVLVTELRSLAAADDVVFLDELNHRARRLFDEKVLTVPELYYRLAMRLKHFLIDEFQDTSRLQWQNLDLMVEEALSVGGSLFYVGDKKQAIYRFRGGDVTLFEALRGRFSGIQVVGYPLSRNFRSRTRIVDFCNKVFSRENLSAFLKNAVTGKGEALLSADDQAKVLKVFEGARQESLPEKKGGYVRVETLAAADKEEREGAVRRRLMDVLREATEKNGFGWGDLAILVRENREVELVSEWLMEEHVPVSSEKTLNIRNNAHIKELVCFLRFLHTPIDNLAFASFALGDLFLAASGLKREEVEDFLFSLRVRARAETHVAYYRAFRENFPGAWALAIDEFFKNIGFIPLYEFVVSILAAWRCLELFSEEQGFFMRFLELIKEEEEERHSVALFLEFFDSEEVEDKLYLKGPAAQAVNVLTIHKAKGLDFPVVIVPFLDMRVSVDAMVPQPTGEGLLLRRITAKYTNLSPVLSELARSEYLRAFIDELNSVYVALTRPREALIVFLPTTARRNGSLVAGLFPESLKEAGEMPSGRTTPEATKTPPLGLSRYGDWIRRLQDEFVDRGILERRHKIAQGEALHYLFSLIGDITGQDKAAVLDGALAKTHRAFPRADLEAAERIGRNVLEAERLACFFQTQGSEVFCEQEVSDRHGHTSRLDRLIVKKDEVWIVDYKSSPEEEPFGREQLAQYRALLKDVFGQKKIRAFLLYLDDARAQEIS